MNAHLRFPRRRSPLAPSPRKRIGAWLTAGLLAAMQSLDAQSVFQETFTGTTANGWYFGGLGSSTSPTLTASTGAEGDTDGNGWLRLTSNTNNQSTYALLDSQIFSVGAQIQIEMEYAFWNDGRPTSTSGADGITFFLVDGSVSASSFTPGAYGGSLGYAQKDQAATGVTGGISGMAGGYLGFGFDNFGNYSNPTEGRVGGTGSSPNSIAVRGPASSNWAYVAGANLNSYGDMDFPNSTSRPTTAASYRSFRLTLDANNFLVVEMKFGTANYVTVFTADLSSYDRPETFKIGFTGATGAEMEIHEVRNVSVITTPGATVGGSFEWDDGKASTDDDWGSGNPAALSGGSQANANWYSMLTGNNDKTPFIDSDIFFGSRPATTSAGVAAKASPYASIQNVNLNDNVQVSSLNFNTKYDYVLGSTTGKTITLGNTAKTGLPSINVTDSIANPRFHTINNALIVAENLTVANQSHSALTLNGTMALGANSLTTSGAGYTNLNGVITGSGPIIVNGAGANGRDSTGIVTLNANNGTSYTGAITVNGGQLVALHNNALGSTSAGTTVNAGGTLTFRGGITTSEPLTLAGNGTALSEIWNAGAVYNDGGNNVLNGAVTLAGDTTIRSRDGNLTINGAIGQTGSNRGLTKTGDGVVTLAGSTASTYTGSTTIQGGALRVTSENALAGGFSTNGYSGGNLALAGGVLEIGTSVTFTRQVGTGNDQVRWTGDGGFSAQGADRTVTLTSGPSTPSPNTAGGQLKWNTDGFVGTGSALILGSTSATHTVTLTNAIDLNGATRIIRADNGSAAVDGVLSGVLSNGGINKTGSGTLELGADNTYTGVTQISGGALRVGNANRIDGSNVTLSGGVLELGIDFSRTLGTGTSAVQWSGSGGFSAYGADRTITLSGGADLNWTSTNFVGTGNSLILGSTSATNAAILTNNIALGSAVRTIQIQDGSATTEGLLSGALSGTGGINVVGSGRLDLTGVNSYTGATNITGVEMRLVNGGRLSGDNSAITISGGGALVMDNTGTAGDYTRVHNSSDFTLNAGRIELIGRASDTTARTETADNVTLTSGANVIRVTRGSGGGNTRLDLDNLTRNTAGATVDFQSGGDAFVANGTSAGPGLIFTGGASLDDGIFAFATVNGTDFATKNSTYIQAYSGYGTNINVTGSGAATTNVALTGASNTLTSSNAVNSLKLGSGANLSLGSNTLTLNSGGLLTTGATASTISGGTLTSGSAEMVIHSYNTGGTTISSTLTGSGATTISGDGKLTLSGTTANTRSGTTTLNTGILELNKSAGVTAIAGDLVIGDTSGEDRVKILANEQIADTATVTLRGGTLLNNNHQAVLDIGNSLETFATLNITGNSVLDFSGGTPSAPSFLVIDVLTIAATDALLTVRNWIDASDYFLVKKSGLDSPAEQANISHIVFEGYGAATWEDYSSDYFMITPHASPVPEPASTGVLALGGLTGCALLRRRRRA